MPIVSVNEEILSLGGAGNVLHNLNALGAKIDVISVLGDCENSIEIKKNGKFYVKPMPASVEFCNHLQSSCFLIYTNKQRKSSKIAESHENKRSLDVKKSIAEISREAYKQFCCQNINK